MVHFSSPFCPPRQETILLVVVDRGILFGDNLPFLRLQRGMLPMLGLLQLEIGVKMLAIGVFIQRAFGRNDG